MDAATFTRYHDASEDLNTLFIALANTRVHLDAVAHFEVVALWEELILRNFVDDGTHGKFCSLLRSGRSFRVFDSRCCCRHSAITA